MGKAHAAGHAAQKPKGNGDQSRPRNCPQEARRGTRPRSRKAMETPTGAGMVRVVVVSGPRGPEAERQWRPHGEHYVLWVWQLSGHAAQKPKGNGDLLGRGWFGLWCCQGHAAQKPKGNGDPRRPGPWAAMTGCWATRPRSRKAMETGLVLGLVSFGLVLRATRPRSRKAMETVGRRIAV